MRRHGIPIDHLYASIKPRLADFQKSNDVHFSDAGYEFLGQRVATALRAAF